jgi:small neutral amino acid transporter SnatA (MarC family)
VEPLPGDLTALEREAALLRAQADALERAYRRATWVRFVLVFFPVPFVLVLLRLHIEAWAYYVAGGVIILSGGILYVIDGAASAKVDAAIAAAEKAERAREAARRQITPG